MYNFDKKRMAQKNGPLDVTNMENYIKEQDKYLSRIQNGLDTLEEKAKKIGTEIDKSTKEIENVESDVDKLTQKIKKEDNTISKIIKKSNEITSKTKMAVIAGLSTIVLGLGIFTTVGK